MAQAAGIGSALFRGVGSGLRAAGAAYEGAQGVGYFNTMASTTMREKERAAREISVQRLEASMVKRQAKYADQEANYTRQIGTVKEQKFQDESDQKISSMFSRMAASGVSMEFGSPMDYIDDAAQTRSEDFALLEWENKHDTYQKEMAAVDLHDKATIMLTQAKIAEAELPMYDYQANIYRQAATEAGKASSWRQMTAYFGAVIDIFGDSNNYNFFNRKTGLGTGNGLAGNGGYLRGGVNPVTGMGW